MTDPIALRASSLADLFDCPARWYARQIEQGGRGPTSGPAQLGTAVHAGTALYDQAALELAPVSVDDAVGAAIEALRKSDVEVVYDDNLTAANAIDLSAALTSRYCYDISPQVVYEAVELKLEPLTINFDNGVRIKLTGSADRVRAVGDRRGISDIKTGRAIVKDGAVATDKHLAQLGVYELLEVMVKNTTSEDMTLPAQVIALPTAGDPTPAIGEAARPSRLLFGNEQHPGLLTAAAEMFKSGMFYGNPKSVLCGQKYCPAWKTCWWRGVTP